MWTLAAASASRSARRQHLLSLLGVAVALTLLVDCSFSAAFAGVRPTLTPAAQLTASVGYSSAPGPAGSEAATGETWSASRGVASVAALVALAAVGSKARSEAASRRQVLASVAVAAAVPVAPAFAAQVPFLGRPKGPFEIDPKDVVIVGDDKSEKAQAAKAKILKLQTEAEKALEAVKADQQADLEKTMDKLGIADLREATNTVNNLMDEISAAGSQRHQRLMIQAKYTLEDDIPMPVSKKGVVQPRGEKRAERISNSLKKYISESKELLLMLN